MDVQRKLWMTTCWFTLALGSVSWGGCTTPELQANRATLDGVPVLGADACCPPLEDRSTPKLIGNVDLQQYGPRLVNGDRLADQLTPWGAGPDCRGRETRLERLIGRRRLAHAIPLFGWLGIGRHSAPGEYVQHRTAEWEARLRAKAWLYFVLDDSQTIDGVRFRDEDVIASDGIYLTKLIDGSDVGTGRLAIDALAVIDERRFLISYSSDFTVDQEHLLPGLVGTVRDEDILLFEAQCLGEETRGTFRLYFDGSDVGLDKGGNDIDALDLLDDGSLVVSFRSSVRLDGQSYSSTDLVRFRPTELGHRTRGVWSLFREVRHSEANAENINALAFPNREAVFVSSNEAFAATNELRYPADVWEVRPQSGTEAANPETLSALLVRFDQPFDAQGTSLRMNNITALALAGPSRRSGQANSADSTE